MKPKPKMTPRMARFCREYMVDLNGGQAAVRAGYSERTCTVIASQLLTKPAIQNEIAKLQVERAKRLDLKADDVLLELLRIARVDLSQAYDTDGNLKPIHEIPEDVRRAIAGIEVEELFEGRGEAREHVGNLRKVKFWDKVKSLELLGKHLKLWVERIEVDGLTGLAERIQAGRSRAAQR